MKTARYCVSGAVGYFGSLLSSFYNTLDEAINALREKNVKSDGLPYLILIDEGRRIVQIIKGGTLVPFISTLDSCYGKKWKQGFIIDIDSVL